ncbi:uncharacterized protein G2W53_015621 [Senna tora]|uniref:Uncharacterized protein n=1 Tax=Senna tora TaxID=362788 RepID=A0A834WVC4_9FABA|nr:uncharacterized protein G2W53_015621 [Senna tora]
MANLLRVVVSSGMARVLGLKVLPLTLVMAAKYGDRNNHGIISSIQNKNKPPFMVADADASRSFIIPFGERSHTAYQCLLGLE